MPSGLRKTTGNHFEIYYEQPWGGVASNADPADIQPNQLVTQSGMLAVNGVLTNATIETVTGQYKFIPYVDNAYPNLIFELGGGLYAVDQFGYLYAYVPGSGEFIQGSTASDGPWSGNICTAVQVINGVAYIANYSRGSIYTFTKSTSIYALASNYVGGMVMGVLDDYLLQLNTNSSGQGEIGSMINWSGPGEFTTWNPASNQLAGFNQVAAVEDEFTGFMSMASVGIAISRKGLTELSPTGIGIGPFQFTVLWTSEVGQGSIYPGSVTQYGQIGYLVTNSGIFSVSTNAGFSDVSGSALEAILTSFQFPNTVGNEFIISFVAGTVMLYFLNTNYSTPYYIFCASSNLPGAGVGSGNVCWMLDIKTGIWASIPFNPIALCNQQYSTNLPNTFVTSALNIGSFDLLPTASSPNEYNNTLTLIYGAVGASNTNYQPFISPIFLGSLAQVITLVFREEEIKLARKPTIRRVVIKASGTGTLNISVSGVSFGSVTLFEVNTAQSFKSPYGMYTGENPQLTITSTGFIGTIVKVMMAGTYADGEID